MQVNITKFRLGYLSTTAKPSLADFCRKASLAAFNSFIMGFKVSFIIIHLPFSL